MNKIYRIEHENTTRSLWYNPDGTFDPFIEKLTEGKTRACPMGFDSKFYDLGTTWFSACYSVSNMRQWFSDLDAFELTQNGYKLYEITARDCRKQEHEIIFTKEGILLKEEIPINTIWNVNKFSKESIII